MSTDSPDDETFDVPADEPLDPPAAMALNSPDDEAFDVPADVDPTRCPDCGRPFVREELLDLHRGYDHSDALDDAATAAFEDAYESESDRLNVFRLKALLALILLYFVLLMTYAVV